MVQKYLAGLGRDNLYRQIRAAACEVPQADPQAMQDAIDLAMMDFGAPSFALICSVFVRWLNSGGVDGAERGRPGHDGLGWAWACW